MEIWGEPPASERLTREWEKGLVEANGFERSVAEEDIGDQTLVRMYHAVLDRVVASVASNEDPNGPDVLDHRQAWWHMSGFIVRALQQRHPDAQPPYADRLYDQARDRVGEAALAGVQTYFNFTGAPDYDVISEL